MRLAFAGLAVLACYSGGGGPPANGDAAPSHDATITDASNPDAAPSDTTPPVFAGVTSLLADTAYSLRLSWTPGTDDHTDAALIEYRAFVATASGAQDFAHPASVIWGTDGGIVGKLQPETDYFVVVRAADRARNFETNVVEHTVRTQAAPRAITLSGDVAPIFAAHCASASCHNAQDLAEGMDLSATAPSFASLVSVQASARPELERVVPGDSGSSYVVRKVAGLVAFFGEGDPMPPPGGMDSPLSDAEIALLREWIDQGSLNN